MTLGRRHWSRRQVLVLGARGASLLGLSFAGGRSLMARSSFGATLPMDGLGASDENGLRLRPGFRSRIVAVSGEPVASTSFVWHRAPDGGATFPAPNGGWVYVSNSELDHHQGSVGAIRFLRDGSVADAYSILRGTSTNCAGGATPWGTWLSCEEIDEGAVYECDPFTPNAQGTKRPALGTFRHEAVAVDPLRRRLYLTEDEPDGLFYRFTPARYPRLDSGRLEVAEILDTDDTGEIGIGETRRLRWHSVSDPSAAKQRTRFQVGAATRFDGGEGCDYEGGRIFFSTKGDDRVWKLDPERDAISILFDGRSARGDSRPDPSEPSSPTLSGVDNVLATPNGDIYVAEDPGQQRIIVLDGAGKATALLQVTGHLGSEVTGPALSPDGTRLYFSSQRSPGTTFEVTGPF